MLPVMASKSHPLARIIQFILTGMLYAPLCVRMRGTYHRKGGGLVLAMPGSIPDVLRTIRENSFLCEAVFVLESKSFLVFKNISCIVGKVNLSDPLFPYLQNVL